MLASSFIALLAASQALAAPHIQKRNHSHLGKRNNGRVTFYRIADSDPNMACQGYYYSDESFPLVALSTHGDFSNDKCGQWITVEYQGKTVSAQIQDGCATCSQGQIDLSPGAMAALDPNYEVTGQFNANWYYGGGGGGDDNKEETTTKEEEKPTPTPTPTPTPEPEPTPSSSSSTWSPEPTPSSSSSETPSTSSSSSTPPPSSSSSSSVISSSSSVFSSFSFNISSTVSALNATATANASVSLNVTANISASATPSRNVTAPIQSGSDHIVQGTGAVESGNLAGVGNLVVSVGRLIALAAGAV